MPVGRVLLVGAGPGDPQLITVRGMNALKAADVVLYDRLAHPDLLLYCPYETECIYVGKAPGDPGQPRQEKINNLLIEHALQGKTVVRLKGGDPFVYGRGGEEALALSAAGIPFEIVPGVSSAIAAAEAAWIPVTHRGTASAFAVFAGHEAVDAESAGIDWETAARIPTAVFLMGVESLAQIVEELLAHGRCASTPVAVIEQATLTRQQVYIGTLRDIVQRAAAARSPATIVVGDVVHIRAMIQSRSERDIAFEIPLGVNGELR